jgi:hypothetical protein
LVRHPDNDLWGAEAYSKHYSITELDTTEATMQGAARCALSQDYSLFNGPADSLDLKYYSHCSTGSTGGVIVHQLVRESQIEQHGQPGRRAEHRARPRP